MAERSKKEFTTSNGHAIVMYDYITGGEFEQLMKAMPSATTDMSSVTVASALEANHLALKLLVRSVDGNAEDVVATILDFPLADYAEVKEAVEALTDSKKK